MFDWRAKLKEEEKDNDPKNMWKKFDSAGPMKAIYHLHKFGGASTHVGGGLGGRSSAFLGGLSGFVGGGAVAV